MATTTPSTAVALDISRVRAAFPALASGYVYLDNAGGSQTLGSVGDRVRDYLLSTNVQLGASYEMSQRCDERVAAGQRAAATLMGASDENEVVLGSSTTQLMQNLAKAMRSQFKEGDEVVVTNVDHEANVGPWARLAERGVTVRTWPINTDSWSLELDDLAPLLTERTKLVAFTHASNVVGTIHPVEKFTRFIHERGAQVCVDGVAQAPHGPMHAAAWGVDYYVLSFYKVYGPHISGFYARREHLERLDNINHFFLKDEIPYEVQPGNLNFELTYSLTGVLDYLEELARGTREERAVAKGATGGSPTSAGAPESSSQRSPLAAANAALQPAYAAIAQHEQALQARLLDFLTSKPNVRIIGLPIADRARRVPTISFVVDGRDSRQIVEQVDPHAIGIRFGHFYAYRLIESLGLQKQNGVIRVSMVHYNTLEEVDRLIAVLDQIL